MFYKISKFRSLTLVIFVAFSSLFNELKAYSEMARDSNADFLLANSNSEAKLKKYMLPPNHPLQQVLKELFKEPTDFDSSHVMRELGFTFFGHYARRLRVCTHPLLENQYVIKKFTSAVPLSTQLDGYLRRLKGRKKVSEYLKRNEFTHIVVPKKYLYELPSNFSDPVTQEKSYLLIAQKYDLCSVEETKENYHQISKEALKELCLFLLEFRGLDSSLENLPFTKEGKIAFIDLDKWEKKRSSYLRRVMEELSEENKEYARELKQKPA